MVYMVVNYMYLKTLFYDRLLIKTLIRFMVVKYNQSVITYSLLRGHYLTTKKRTRKVLVLRNINFKRNFRYYASHYHVMNKF